MAKIIDLSNGGFTVVDDIDFDELSKHTWRKDQYGYATRVKFLGKKNGKQKLKTLFMHREILNAPVGKDVDHRNRDRLDNQRSNLRLASRSQNNINAKLHNNNTSGFKGVSFHKQAGKWRAYISKDGVQMALGLFDKIEDAVTRRVLAEKNMYGEFSDD